MWSKFGNSNISMREVVKTWIFFKDLTRKTTFFWGVVLNLVQLFETGTRYGLEILQQC